MIKNITRLAAIVAFALTTQVQADETQDTTAQSTSPFSISVEGGYVEQKLDVSGGFESEVGRSFSPSIALNYAINENFSIVGQYTAYGEAEMFNEIIGYVDNRPLKLGLSTKSTGLSLVGQYNTVRQSESWYFGAKLGLTSWSTDIIAKAQYAGETETGKEDDNGVAIYGGLLAAYAVNENLDLTFNADWFTSEVDVEIIPGETNDILRSRYAFGFKYHF